MENEFTQNNTTQTETKPVDSVAQAKKHFSKLGLMFFFGTLIIYAVQLGASAIANAINPELQSTTSGTLLVMMIPMYVIAMPIMGLLIKRVPASQITPKKMTAGQLIIAFLMCYGVMYVSNLIGVILTQVIGFVKGSAVSNTFVEIASSSSILVNFFIMAICAPIAEELIFRKLLIDRTVKYGEGLSVVLSGLLFGLFHGNLNQFAYAFALGAFWGFIYVKTGKIIYTIVFHMIINFIGSVLGMIVLNFVGEGFIDALNDPALLMPYMMENMGRVMVYMVYTFLLIAIAFTGIILFVINAKKIHFFPGEVTLPKGKRFSTVIVNLGMALFCIFWLIMIIIQLFQ